MLLITGRGKTSMVDHFDRRPDLEARLEEKGDAERLAAVRRPSELAEIYTCRQAGAARPRPRGRRTPSRTSATSPFAVLLGDEFVETAEPLLPAMLDLQARTGGIVLAFFEVDPAETKRYGIASVEPAEPELTDIGEVVKVTGLVEKPQPEDAPSNLAVARPVRAAGADLRRDPADRAGQRRRDPADRRDGSCCAARAPRCTAIVYRGTRYDTGMPLGYLQAVVQIAAERDDLGAEFRAWLAELRQQGPTRRDGSRHDDRSTADAEAAANELTPLADYLGSVLRRLRALPPLDLDLTQAHGNVLAEDVVAPHAVPGLRPGGDRRVRRPLGGHSVGAGTARPPPARPGRPVRLNVVGDLGAASWRPVRLTPGTCFSVAAGAPLPVAADVVVPVRLDRPGHGRGGDLPHAPSAGTASAAPARSCRPARCSPAPARTSRRRWSRCFAATGIGHVVVRPSPRVVIVATGDELVDVGRASQPGQVVDANSHALTAAAAEAGALRTGSASATTTRRGCAGCWRTRRCGPT